MVYHGRRAKLHQRISLVVSDTGKRDIDCQICRFAFYLWFSEAQNQWLAPTIINYILISLAFQTTLSRIQSNAQNCHYPYQLMVYQLWLLCPYKKGLHLITSCLFGLLRRPGRRDPLISLTSPTSVCLPFFLVPPVNMYECGFLGQNDQNPNPGIKDEPICQRHPNGRPKRIAGCWSGGKYSILLCLECCWHSFGACYCT